MNISRKKSIDEIVSSLDKDTVNELLKLVDHKTMVEFAQSLNAQVHILNATSDGDTLSANILKEVFIQAKVFFNKQEQLLELFEVIRSTRTLEDISWITNEHLFISLVLHSQSYDDELQVALKDWLRQTMDKQLNFCLTSKLLSQLKEVVSHQDLLLLIKKDIIHHQNTDDIFADNFENYFYMQSKKSLYDSLLGYTFSNTLLWFKSLLFKDIINPFALRKQLHEVFVESESNFVKDLIKVLRNKPSLLSKMKKDAKVGALLSSIDNFEDKILKLWSLDYTDLKRFKSVIDLHLQLNNGNCSEKKIADNIKKHIRFQNNGPRNIYLLYYQSKYNPQDDIFFYKSLDLVFSKDNEFNKNLYNSLLESSSNLHPIVNLPEFCYWMQRENISIDRVFFNNFIQLAMVNHPQDQILSNFVQSDLYSNLSFKFTKDKDLKLFEGLESEVLKRILFNYSKAFDISFILSLKLKLYFSSQLSFRDLQSTFSYALRIRDKEFSRDAFNYYHALESVESNMYFTKLCHKVLACLDHSEMNCEQRALYYTPFSASDFNPVQAQKFLSWYLEVPERSQDKLKAITRRNYQNIFSSSILVDSLQIEVIKQTLSFMGLESDIEKIDAWSFTNYLIDQIDRAENEGDLLTLISKIDFNTVKTLSPLMRGVIADQIDYKNESNNHNLYNTLVSWFENIDSPDIHKLLTSPKQYTIDLIHSHHHETIELNPIAADYVYECLSESERHLVHQELLKMGTLSESILSFVHTVSKMPLSKAQISDISLVVDSDASQEQTREEHQLMGDLARLQSYLLGRVHKYVKHPALISDLMHQASLAVKSTYYDDTVIKTLENQIKAHPTVKLKYDKTFKTAQNIFYIAWVDNLRVSLSAGQVGDFERSCKELIASHNELESKKGRCYLNKVSQSFNKVEKREVGERKAI